jgi:predicted Zn-dependent peptidase
MKDRKHIRLWLFIILLISVSISAASKKLLLENGIRLIVDQDTSSRTTVIQILLKGGKQAEPALKNGLAYLTTRLSIELPDTLKQKKIIEMASRINFRVFSQFCIITLNCLSENLSDTLEIFSTVFSKPLFSGLRINRNKNHMAHLQKLENENDLKWSQKKLKQIFFNLPQYHGSVYGDPESLKNISGKDILEFHRQYFHGRNMTVAVSSNLPEAELIPVLSQGLSGIPSGHQIEFQPLELNRPNKREFFLKRRKKHFFIALAWVNSELNPKNFARIFLLENLMGKGIGSILWELREQEKLAYQIDSFSDIYQNTGLFLVYLKTHPEKRARACEKLTQLVSKLYQEGLKPETLKAHKNYARSDFLRLNETKERRAFYLAFFEALGLGYQYLDQVPADIDRIRDGDFNDFLKTIFNPENRIEFVIGPEA